MIWIVFALLTGVAVFSALWPLSRPAPKVAEDAADVAFYRAQIDEIDAERERGAIDPDQAEAAKALAARRLIAAAPQETPAAGAPVNRKIAAALALVFVPLVAVGLYTQVGHPDLPDMPLEARLKSAPAQGDFMVAVAKMEAHIAAHPEDGKALELMAPVWQRLGDAAKAVHAREEALRLLGETPERHIRLAEAMANANNGDFTPQAEAHIARALQMAPKSPEVRYFVGAAAAQKGEFERAREIWSALAADLPEGSPPRVAVDQQIAELDAKGPVAQKVAQPSDAQQKTINAMVEGLAKRLSEKGGSAEEWARLIRAYKVLNENDKAKAALDDARKALAQDAGGLAKIDAQARELGVDGK
ncbi:cytochrome c-type biogenesis protein CcmH [Rhodoblastus acidophilus]|uniref:Cytochrome c-type biogenesis protein CcmH n=1 Tax=Rhodoblastus acidophilus TaxID=1074 RepID=A0A212QNJ7_RHOAC|nr:c-type cytochrome biogenesis protein CcmI [Rhodoblastus acidophilus]PPQ38948.1 c-type cytochrome biogenesis protein CcmI [Rhodoblastus acidophilus]RAI20115.1 c-type cytochrome biogenesis protein CcmI [Rhodoblastus acidophilus]SNB60987.1 cytochrome c-type biogenesis protein CcmH [Rhodoblastus acidophilus]